ncbi:hypothetical protein [Actinoplanes sp. GCM10030250]|uniref:hypothetical protein n=1 Tax=Actinoplanes sp. GCM10030250 TaxID=3273376 RepID=UPI003605DE92
MNRPRPGMPRFDDTVTAANVHERAEQVAVPNFDWMSGPVLAFVDGLLHIDPDAPLPRRRRYSPPRPIQAAPHTDDAAHSAGHLLADITRINPHR